MSTRAEAFDDLLELLAELVVDDYLAEYSADELATRVRLRPESNPSTHKGYKALPHSSTA
jgi:hypothetical protein